jgi:hypothetical protein
MPPDFVAPLPALEPLTIYMQRLSTRGYEGGGEDGTFDPIAAVLPRIMDSPFLMALLLDEWARVSGTGGGAAAGDPRVRLLCRCVGQMWPLMHVGGSDGRHLQRLAEGRGLGGKKLGPKEYVALAQEHGGFRPFSVVEGAQA